MNRYIKNNTFKNVLNFPLEQYNSTLNRSSFLMTEFENQTANQKELLILKKVIKKLSFWHDQWKRLHLKASETAVKNTELQQEVHETMKVMTDSIMDIRQTYQSLLPLTQAMLELTDRVKKLEQKNTGKDHP